MVEYLSVRENWLQAMWIAFAWMAGAPLLLSAYYHWNVSRLAGRGRMGFAAKTAGMLRSMFCQLHRNRFDYRARRLMGRVYLGVFVWIIGLFALFGPLLYVDNLMQKNGGWPEAQADDRGMEHEPIEKPGPAQREEAPEGPTDLSRAQHRHHDLAIAGLVVAFQMENLLPRPQH